MGDWKELLKNGLGVAVVAFVFWFLAYRVWPVVVKAMEDYKVQLKLSQESRDKSLEQFDEALKRRDDEFSKVVYALQNLSDEIRGRK